ncbi:hypothetical protein CIB95_06680 [Lottiidibacillus patelloidae]|uniref:Uncharacterized protein n=1 Tax=Lottiidibacillus patelloidae TaxID=2670334 RepID=A0A263BTV4_9BACI|nr:hypothetical protein [Lottiidibacillus patelloidae]OZM57149.1 hypothetical protein CIB95_06680 [Lottiidibacillus patelloidae]
MIIKKISGYELEKELPNTSEDFFNRSLVTYERDGEEETFHLLYVRFFEENMKETTPFEKNPLFTIGEREYLLADIVALVALLKDEETKNRKRIYINEENEFKKLFNNINIDYIKEIATSLQQSGSYKIN